MAFTKRDVKDRVVQYPRRYQLVEVQSGIFDLIPVTGTITEPGTAINKAYLQPIEDILNSLLNIGTDKAKIAETAENSTLSDALQSFDTRAVNSTPQQIFDSMKKQMKLEFKQKSTIGNPPVGGTYVALLTINAYGDATGGYPTQLAIGTGTTGEIAIRIGTGASTWGTWVNITVPLNHASSGSAYGLGDASNYGHVKTRNDLVGTETSGAALTPAMGKSLNDKINSDYTIEIITTSKSWIVPANVRSVDVFMISGGSGGGGGGASRYPSGSGSSGNMKNGGEGGRGGRVALLSNLPVTAGNLIPIVIGAGSAGSAGGVYSSTSEGGVNGNALLGDGGDTSFLGRSTSTNIYWGQGGYWETFENGNPGSAEPFIFNNANYDSCPLNNVKYCGGGGGGGSVYTSVTNGGNGANNGGKGGNSTLREANGNASGLAGVNGTLGGGGGGGGAIGGRTTYSGTWTGGKGGNGGNGVCIIRYKEGK